MEKTSFTTLYRIERGGRGQASWNRKWKEELGGFPVVREEENHEIFVA